MVKQTPEEIRREVMEADAKKDVSIYLSVPVAVVAGLSATGAVCVMIALRALAYFRQGVDTHWLICAPFLFPFVTGVFAAYKKQFALFGVHLSVNLLALLIGGLGFGQSVESIFTNRHLCVPIRLDVPCEKTSLSYLFIVCGSLAAGFAVIGFLMTICAMNSATKRIARREHELHIQHLREQEEKQRELRQRKSRAELVGRTLSVSSESASHSTSAAPNGLAQTLKAQAAADAKTSEEGKASDDLITRL